jgi:hypothetical protein
LEVDEFAQIFGQPRILTLQPQIFFLPWRALALRPALLRSQRFEDAVWPAPAASRPAATSTSLRVGGARYASAACGSGGLAFLKDANFIFRGEGVPLLSRPFSNPVARPAAPRRRPLRLVLPALRGMLSCLLM